MIECATDEGSEKEKKNIKKNMSNPTSSPDDAAAAADKSKSNVPSNIPSQLFPLTPQEQSLLDLYAQIKQYEREAAQAAADAAKAKLDKANEEYQKEIGARDHSRDDGTDLGDDGMVASTGQKKKRKKRRRNNENQEMGLPGSEDDEYSDDEVSMDDGDDENNEQLNELEELRAFKDAADRKKQKEMASEIAKEELREQYLVEDVAVSAANDFGPSLKKKKTDTDFDDDYGKDMSLISNMNNMSTPPHDFSKKLGMSKVSGKQLFPVTPDEKKWDPPQDASDPEDRCLEMSLSGLDIDGNEGNNTIAIKFMAPLDSRRFSINIAQPNHENYYSVLFHFNPRQFEKGGQVVMNDKKAGMWGQGINIPLSTMPLMFGETSCTLIVQITGDGFDVFLNNQHVARLEHRTPLPDKSSDPKSNSLILQFPSTDDYGTPEDWRVYKVWWGHKAPMASTSSDLSNVAGVNSYNSVHEKKLFVSGLPKLSSQPELELRVAELERAFRKYGGAQGANVICPPNSTFAFVELETERQTDLALREMGSRYRLNRARRSKHEALLEQRAAAERATGGTEAGSKRETTDWD